MASEWFTSTRLGARLDDVIGVSCARGIDVVFDWAFDGSVWTGSGAGPGTGTAGEAWFGPLRLLERLELELGLGGTYATSIERTADLARTLADTEGFWTRSLEVDPIATTTRLLDDRDALMFSGWQGEPASERLASLWSATRDARLGIPDRLRQVISRLTRGRPEMRTIRIVEPIKSLPPLWQQVFLALERVGVRIVEAPIRTSAASGDLGASRLPGFTPVGDGSLQLVRPHGPLGAAEEVAAALAATQDLRGLVVIGPDAMLDAALVRHGLPRLGAAIPAPGSCALIRLCIESAFYPMNPDDLHALLCVDPGPVPRRIAWRLAAALRRFPGRGSIEWREALASGLDAIDDDRRPTVATRLAALFEPMSHRTGVLTIDQLASRMLNLVTWARSRIATDPTLGEVIALADRLISIATLCGAGTFKHADLGRLCAEISQPFVTGFSASLGLSSVANPGAMLGSARTVVWWDFSRARAPSASRLRLSVRERAALGSVGVIAPDGGSMMAHEARRWRRPLMLASAAVILVCPQFDEAAEPAHIHPLWDELIAAMPESSVEARLHAQWMSLPSPGGAVSANRETVGLRAAPLPIEVVHMSRAIPLRDIESASSIEQLLGCPLAYVLHYAGKLRSGLRGGALESTPLLYGNLAHHVLAEVFVGGALTPEVAAASASVTFDRELPRLAETLLLPDHQAERAALRLAIIESARALASLVVRTGATIRGVELMLEGTFGPAAIKSRADLVLADPDHVIDLKWGTSANRETLRAGAAIQLAMYAELARTGAVIPGAAYLILSTQRLLATRGTELPGAIVPTAHSADDMLHAARGALGARVGELTSGHLVAPGAVGDAPKSQLANGVLRVAPSCGYCELEGLCGRRGRP